MKRASEAPFPYGWPGWICYFVMTDEGSLTQLKTRPDFRQAVSDALSGGAPIFAAWPGQYRTDLFLIDEPHWLAVAIGVAAA